MINAEDFFDQVAAVTKHQIGDRRVRIGYVDSDFDETRYPGIQPRVYLDGEGLTHRGYPCVSSYVPMRGDRVILLPVGENYVILGSIERSDRDLLVPGQLVFQAIQNTEQAVASGTSPVPILWDEATFDLIGGWSILDNPSRYSPPVPGWYEFNGAGSLRSNAGGSFRDVRWMFNGNTETPFGHARYAHTGSNASAAMPARNRAFLMNGTTDYVELAIVHNAGATINTNGAVHYRPHIEVKYVGPPANGNGPTNLSLE